MTKTIHIIGGGMAGCEAAWQAAHQAPELNVVLHEMRPHVQTHAHQGQGLAELVCSNSFRSDDHTSNAVGVLHQEMRMMDSLLMGAAVVAAVPAGGALAVDRNVFSDEVERRLTTLPNVTIVREELDGWPPADWESVIIATGPLTSSKLADAILAKTSEESLAFFDAIAPIIHRDSINMDKAWFQSRYDKGDGTDYINCPLDEQQYNAFIDALLDAEKTVFHEWEESTPYFEGCLPIEVMASRGRETLRFGPMKPVGLTNTHTGEKAHAVVQLRQDNKLGTLFNIVGFQTKMKYGAQVEVLRAIPGLENAEFARLGGIHRNTFLNSPHLLDEQLRLKAEPRIRFAGQVTGVEGYVESGAMGLLTGRMIAAEALGKSFTPPPITTGHGALMSHVTGGANAETFQPMNVNFGLMPPPTEKNARGRNFKGRERKEHLAARALTDFQAWINAQVTA